MENKIQSFTVNHDKLLRGIYVSRKDEVGNEIVTTFDIRMKVPNKEPVLGNPENHTIEHLMATYLRLVSDWSDKVVYAGPMGCRTGMYLILKGDLESRDIVDVVTKTFEYIRNYEGEIPGNTSVECGNYLDHNLVNAKYEADKFLKEVLYVIKEENLVYPEY